MAKHKPTPRGSLPQVGDVVAGKYRVEAVIGSGGMGVVLAARHLQLGELVALKLLHPSSGLAGESVARLMREARATACIKSEHVVRVLDVGTLETGSPYILMEFLEGADLAATVRARGPLPIPEAVDYLLQACEAIVEARWRGVIHRDLKPSNLFLARRADGSSVIKVLDFGIAKALIADPDGSGPQSLTMTTSVFGSPAYMSPEQIRSAKRVDERTDVWALGVILHELLTGTLPFPAETLPGLLAAVAADAPSPLRAGRPDAPEELERVVVACLAKDVTARTQTAARLAAALAPFAPPASAPSLQRIERMSAAGSRPPPAAPSDPQMNPGSSVPVVAPELLTTVEVMTTSKHLADGPSRAMRWGVVAAAVVLVGAGVIVMRDRRARPPASTDAALTVQAPSTPAPPLASQPDLPPVVGTAMGATLGAAVGAAVGVGASPPMPPAAGSPRARPGSHTGVTRPGGASSPAPAPSGSPNGGSAVEDRALEGR